MAQLSLGYTATELAQKVRDRFLVPFSINTYSDTKIINEMNYVMQMGPVAPEYKSQVEEFLVETHTFPFDPLVTTYSIPTTAMNGVMRDFALLDNHNNPKYVVRIDPSDIKTYGVSGSNASFYSYPVYYIENDNIVLWWGTTNLLPQSNNFTQIKFSIYRMPNVLVDNFKAAQITAISGNALTVNAVPTNFDTTTLCDFIKGDPQFTAKGFQQIDGYAITNITGLVITFASIPTNLVVGDWVSQTKTSPIPMVPYSSFSLLIQKTGQVILEGLNHPKAQIVAAGADKLQQQLIKMMKRNDAQPQQLTHKNSIIRFI